MKTKGRREKRRGRNEAAIGEKGEGVEGNRETADREQGEEG